ncbi:TetR/AcrR family transcriptional regulator [Kordiimonas lacus]|uniref:Transcriptional regulator, TetR family n=1 Tax=Kordiimonas lacus TaxID=637679 RepID=A0A1G7EBG1_9PROT|nr:TetR/AcrR family transcriptional regulator [Kordiimonas lacus]SDE60950.1 transcriptional regulator, TetR family [Kordiimonas lacus]
MTRPPKYSKAAMAQRLEQVFKENGYEGASLQLLAATTGLSKASLYHHFPSGKSEMAAHVLAYSGARLQKLVLGPLGAKKQAGLLKSLAGTANYYDGDIPICLMNSLLLGEGRDLFGDRIQAAVEAWQSGLSGCLVGEGAAKAEAQAWAADAIGRIQGALVLCRVQGSRAPLDDCLEGLTDDVESWLAG